MSPPLTAASLGDGRGRRHRRCRSVGAATSLLLLAQASSIPSAADALSERDALLRFYHLAGGEHWKKNAGWREAAEASEAAASSVSDGDDGGGAAAAVDVPPMCSWHGIACETTPDGREAVTGIDLSYNHLSGRVSQHLYALPSLKMADLRGNLLEDAGLRGFASDLGGAAPLESLKLSENRLTSLEGIASAPGTLHELHVSSNAFEGTFPGEVFRLRKLRTLRASYNAGIDGTMPSEIGGMSNLRELELSYTSMGGTIPSEIGMLTHLEILSLDDNRFRGNLPMQLESLLNLKYLSIQNGEEGSGRITGPLPSFGDSANLKELYLNDNALAGTIPTNFLEHSLLTDRPVAVGLKRNKLVGKIPHELSRFEKLHLEVQGNRINGIPNELCHKKKWMLGRVAAFGCDAILCPKGTFSAESGRRESEEGGCEACPNGEADAPHLGSLDCRGASTSEAVADDGAPLPGGADVAASSSLSSDGPSGGMGGGAKFVVVFVSLSAFVVLGASAVARRAVVRRRHAREAMEEAELEEQANNGAVLGAADAGANAELGEAGMLDIPLGDCSASAGPSSPGVNRCIL